MAEALFWAALACYGVAAVSFAAVFRASPRAARVGRWGARLGWLLQTGLIALQAVEADGFAWASWAGSLNLFVWLVAGAYLIWGCRVRYQLLGTEVLPIVTVLLAVAYAGGGASAGREQRYSTLFLVLHVGLVLVAFAGFTLAAALSALYLWQERRLKRREAGVLRVPAPALVKLDDLLGRTITVALPALTLGIVAGAVRLAARGGGLDVLMVVTLVTWAVYGAFVLLRFEAGWHGRRAAYLALVGFALVVAVRLGLPSSHFA